MGEGDDWIDEIVAFLFGNKEKKWMEMKCSESVLQRIGGGPMGSYSSFFFFLFFSFEFCCSLVQTQFYLS